ncbi:MULTISPECIES: hypothetical protein [Brevibacillus]|jgi:hypothetical protein|uniref:YokE-like PH domain-containing protein n=1 Tax=Brevibacillus borstelensis AK1 TaxID=1300222 RepID=M8E9C1_9BACL|nr:hypothetical protein [Brevibacillus borstelensis]EMT52070.1 hypothetical protein I532_14543 [Brevibacillus borstelensis AK1]KKX53550.1 hypothetical protein X546_19420 [Brevibacillus borstelensis cifa_chp40]MBE5396046.1 hypothetical protein [Brevibacillus borstelensis]MCC0566613.1 hypothetical protein [Brevibacillus borstelensis]MCM3472644.1 hypothetical protein [Brevibacillus borstelensis]
MNSDFIRLKNLEGELMLTQLNKSLGCSVTSKELVFFKPHMTYHLFLHDIVSMVPIKLDNAPITFRHKSELIRSEFGSDYYKLTVKWARIVTRSGITERENMEFIVPLSRKMLDYIAQYSGLIAIG